MKNKLAVTLTATGLSLYGLVGFWMSIGYTVMNPIFFYSIMAAIFLSPIAIFWSAFLLSKELTIRNTIRSGILCILAAIISFALLILWMLLGDRGYISNGTFFAFGSGVFITAVAASAVYALSFMILAAVKKLKS
ncbi:MAG: hypothetical protein IKL00_05660 [Oscillospiraceae bacterium]|nr:hypothetical protein [Oscillospiraceae bacterium]